MDQAARVQLIKDNYDAKLQEMAEVIAEISLIKTAINGQISSPKYSYTSPGGQSEDREGHKNFLIAALGEQRQLQHSIGEDLKNLREEIQANEPFEYWRWC